MYSCFSYWAQRWLASYLVEVRSNEGFFNNWVKRRKRKGEEKKGKRTGSQEFLLAQHELRICSDRQIRGLIEQLNAFRHYCRLVSVGSSCCRPREQQSRNSIDPMMLSCLSIIEFDLEPLSPSTYLVEESWASSLALRGQPQLPSPAHTFIMSHPHGWQKLCMYG